MSRLLFAILLTVVGARRIAASRIRARSELPELRDPPELVDVTHYMDAELTTLEGYRCCCDKEKGIGIKDWLRGASADRANYCTVVKTSSCGHIKVTNDTVKAHSHASVNDQKCDILSSELPEFMSIVGVLANEPEVWKVNSGFGWDEEKADLEKLTQRKQLPTMLEKLLEELDEDPIKKQLLSNTWTQADSRGFLIEIPAWVKNIQTVELEEGDALVVLYRVQENDIDFTMKHVGEELDEDFGALVKETTIMRETLYSRMGSTSVIYWRPDGGFDLDRKMYINLVWDNEYSWIASKKVMAVVGVWKPPRLVETSVKASEKTNVIESEDVVPGPKKLPLPPKKWTKSFAKPKPIDSLVSSQSVSSQNLSLNISEHAGHALNKEQCDEAARRIGGKQGFLMDIALTGYLKEIGQSPNADMMVIVKRDIEKGCDIAGNELAMKSDAEFLTPEQCEEAKKRAGNKQGMFLELVIKAYLKENNKKPSPKMISRATEQIAANCEEENNILTTPQCLGIKTVVEMATEPAEQLEEIGRGLQAFGQAPTAKKITDTAIQISNACPVQALSLDLAGKEIEEVVPPKVAGPPKKIVPVATPLDPGECQEANEAIKGKPTMFAGIHLGKWLKEHNKDNSPKAIDLVLAQLQGGCSGAPALIDQMVIDSGKKVEEEVETHASVSSGTKRRKDFCEDARFAKYRMMKKIGQPEGAVNGRVTMDKGDLLKAGLTELELECFVKLLFETVDECDVAPPKEGKILTKDFIDDTRLKKYKMMHKLKQSRGMVESRITMDKGDLLKDGLTQADLDCLLQLLFDEVEECDASPAGKILGPEFVQLENEFFAKYRKMKKLRQPAGAVEGRITMDMGDLKKLGFTKTDMDCFLKLLFEEVDKCITGPAERIEKQSAEARGLAVATDVHEKLTSLLDGGDGLLPGVLPSLDWATTVFEATLPKTKEKEKPAKVTGESSKEPELETFLDGKTLQNLLIALNQFPKDMVFDGYMAEVGRGEWSFVRKGQEGPPLLADLENFQRAVLMVSDAVCEEVKPNVDKITEKHDQAHRFVKALIQVKYSKEEPQLNEIMTCMLQEKGYAAAIQNKASNLEKLQEYYNSAGDLIGTISAAANGFVVQLLNARMKAAKGGTSKVSKESFDQYDTVLRKFRQSSGSGDESPDAIVPLLAFNNVIIEKSNLLRVGLKRSNPALAKTLSPTYLELFNKFLDSVIEAEKQQAVKSEEEPPLTYDECEKAKEAVEAAKNPMFKEMALNNHLKKIGKSAKKEKVVEQLKEPCKKAPVKGPLTDQECQDALDILKKTPNPMFQGIKLANFFKEDIERPIDKAEAEKQVRAGCPSDKPPEPLYLMSTLRDKCRALVDNTREEPSSRNSVRGAIAGVAETQKKVQECVAVMPAVKQAPYESLLEEGQVVIDIAKQVQESLFAAMIQSQGPFLPHDKKGAVDKAKLWELHDNLPAAGGNDDVARIRGENGVPAKYSLSDFLDDEALRYSTKRMCEALL